MLRFAIKLPFRPVGIYRSPPQVHYASRAISTIPTAYSKVTMKQAEKRLGFMFVEFENHAISVSQMLAEAKPEVDGLGKDGIRKTKELVYKNIMQFIQGEGYPTESNEDFKEANVNDLVLLIILPILTAFRCKTGRRLLLQREKAIIATDSETGGYQEFVVMDFIGVGNRKFVFVVEAKKASVGEAKRQCLLAMKDMGDKNGGSVVYGFITTGEQWQMLRYDGMVFTQTCKFLAMSETMGQEKGKWMKDCSCVVDCIHAALRSGGCVVDN